MVQRLSRVTWLIGMYWGWKKGKNRCHRNKLKKRKLDTVKGTVPFAPDSHIIELTKDLHHLWL